MIDRSFHPDFKAEPYWWDAAPPEDASGEALPERVDVLIVGSGFAGLSAALEAARAGVSVAVLDSGLLGGGASSRSGGMVSSGQKLVLTEVLRGLPAIKAQVALEDSKATFEFLPRAVGRGSAARGPLLRRLRPEASRDPQTQRRNTSPQDRSENSGPLPG